MGNPVYCNDGGSDTAPYDTWAKAAQSIVTALAAVDAGGTIYIQSDHVEQFGANTTLASANGTLANPVTIISVTNTNEPPVAGDYENMVTGGGNLDAKTLGAYDLNFTGLYDIWIGLDFIVGDDVWFAWGLNDKNAMFCNCRFQVTDDFYIGGSENCTLYFNDITYVETGDGKFITYSNFVWRGGAYSWNGGSVPTNLLALAALHGNVLIEDVDIQDLDAGDYLVSDAALHNILFKRCKIPAAVNYMNAGPTGPACQVRFHSVDDGNFIYRFNEYYFEGQIVEDVAVYRNSAATYDGTNEYSVKMISNANAKEWVRPLRFKLADIWCAANPTITVELNTDNVVLQNDEFWIEIEYPDGTTGALGQVDRTSKPATLLTAPANLTTSAVDWTEGFGTEKPQKISETIAGGQAGVHTIWACLAKPSTTVYVCPKIDVS